MIKQFLHDNWTVRAVGDLSEVPAALRGLTLPAQVPGCVHTDLLRAGKISDPYRDLNEFETRWIGHTDWQYRTTFAADEKMFDHERIDLVCDGLDTVARIELNGQRVAETQNMHRGYRFDVRPMLKRDANELVVTFASPVKYAERMRENLKPRPYCNGPGGPFNFIRKMACNFGWDWGPALPTSGIWRGVRLEGWSDFKVERVEISTIRASDGSFELRLCVIVDEFEYPPTFRIKLSDPDGRDVKLFEWWDLDGDLSDESRRYYSLFERIRNPKVWWPKGYGEQPLYRLTLECWDSGRETLLETHEFRIGLRTVELDTSPDDIGRKFFLKVNGKPIFCKGFNWIPDDCFLDRANEPRHVSKRIHQAVDAGANMLRIWGGGIFETDEFYNICDEMGVLVWQDFLFACGMYPEEEPFWSEVEAEARYNVARLAHHPSLTIWNGCNENIWAYRDWGWKDHEDQKDPAGGIRTWGKNYYFDLLPRICKELTPTIPYWAGSPWSGDFDVDNGVPPNAATHGNKHVWEAWFKQDYSVYRTFEPRFCSEFGFQAPATYSSIANVVPIEARDFGSLEMRHRQKSGDRVRDDGDRRNLRHLIRHFNLPGAQELYDALEPADPKAAIPYCGCEPLLPAKVLPSKVNFDDLHYLLQVNQARALTLGVEWFRSRQPTCMGTLYWQLNDCWPGSTSWSCIDGDGKKKPLWYATRRFYEGYLPTIQPEPDGSLSVYLINDTDHPVTVSGINAWRQSFDGEVFAQQVINCEAPARSVHRVPLDPAVAIAGDPSREMIHFGDEIGTVWFFKPDKELNYPKPRFRASLYRLDDDEYDLSVMADTLMRDVCVFVDRLDPDATISEQLVTMLEGDSQIFSIRSKRELTLEQLTSPLVLRCVNEFGNSA